MRTSAETGVRIGSRVGPQTAPRNGPQTESATSLKIAPAIAFGLPRIIPAHIAFRITVATTSEVASRAPFVITPGTVLGTARAPTRGASIRARLVVPNAPYYGNLGRFGPAFPRKASSSQCAVACRTW